MVLSGEGSRRSRAAARSDRRRTDAAGPGHALIDRRRAAFGQHADIPGALDPEMADRLVGVAVIPLAGALPGRELHDHDGFHRLALELLERGVGRQAPGPI